MQSLQKVTEFTFRNHEFPNRMELIQEGSSSKNGSSHKSTFRKFVAEHALGIGAGFDERKFLADRCRAIKAQAFAIGPNGNGKIFRAINGIEDYLIGVGSPLAMQMLGDLQAAGFDGFNSWCAKYGV